MRTLGLRGAAFVLIVLATVVLSSESALAHTGSDAGVGHLVVEFAKWGGAVAAGLLAAVALFWARSRFAQRRKQ